jgi:photosystem II stability/assembly factor-like uncharacterized protein
MSNPTGYIVNNVNYVNKDLIRIFAPLPVLTLLNSYSMTFTINNVGPSVPGQYIATNSTGKYVTVGCDLNIFVSSDYGVSFTTVNIANNNIFCVTMSSSGQYQYACSTGIPNSCIYYSINSGLSWTLGVTVSNNNRTRWTKAIACDSSGQYIITADGGSSGSNNSYYSKNYGTTWTRLNVDVASRNSCTINSGTLNAYAVGGRVDSGFIHSYNLTEATVSEVVAVTTSINYKWITSCSNGSVNKLFCTNVNNQGFYSSTGLPSNFGSALELPATFVSVWYNSAGTQLWAASSTTIYYSNNDGTSWSSIPTVLTNIYGINISSNRNYLYLLTQTGSIHFLDISSYSQASATGFIVNNTNYTNKELNTIFAPYTSGTKASATGYYCQLADLNTIFAPNSLVTYINFDAIYNSNGTAWTSGTYYFANVATDVLTTTTMYGSFNNTDAYQSFTGIKNITQSTTQPVHNTFLTDIAMSTSGKYQTIIENGGYIYYSSDYGVTWARADTGILSWTGIAIATSTDGTLQFVVTTTRLYKSTDYGKNWIEVSAFPESGSSMKIAISHNGQYQTVLGLNSFIYYSATFGVYWTSTSAKQNWSGIAMSSDANYQIALNQTDNKIYRSTNKGMTWSATQGITQPSIVQNWRAIAMSSTGQYQTVIGSNTVGNAYFFYSNNYGQTWNSSSVAIFGSNNKLSMSSNGQIQINYDTYANIYTSIDYGVNWSLYKAISILQPNGVCVISSTGTNITFVETSYYTGKVYTLGLSSYSLYQKNSGFRNVTPYTFPQNTGLSWTFWIYPVSQSPYNLGGLFGYYAASDTQMVALRLLSKTNDRNPPYYLNSLVDGNNSGTPTSGGTTINSTTSCEIPANAWTHVAWTISPAAYGSTTATHKFYLNGDFKQQVINANYPQNYSRVANDIGSQGGNASNESYIDNFRFYTRELTASNINLIYTTADKNDIAIIDNILVYTAPSPAPIIHYIFNSGYLNSNNTYLQNAATGVYDLELLTTTITTKQSNNCLYLGPSTSRQYATVNNSVSNNSTGLINSTTTFTGITINLWLYFENSINTCDIFEYYNTSDAITEMEFQIDGGNLKFYFNYNYNTNGTYVSFGAPVLNNWVMFTLTFNGVSYITYRNSTPVNSGTANGTSLANFVNTNRNSLSFGKSIYNNGAGIGNNNASIADFRMYSSGLSASQIEAIYNAGISNS